MIIGNNDKKKLLSISLRPSAAVRQCRNFGGGGAQLYSVLVAIRCI
jgi:hypothetical protein